MKASKLTYLVAMVLALTFVATGCRKKPSGVTPLPGQRVGSVGDPNLQDGNKLPGDRDTTPGDTVGTPMSDRFANLDNFNQDREKFKSEMVHFDYDSASVKSSEMSKISAVASGMKSLGPNIGLLVEGHCDERGTEEYNRALGERRALAVREALIASGVESDRIVTKSFGKDKKIDFGASDASHARNRRCEFVTLTPK